MTTKFIRDMVYSKEMASVPIKYIAEVLAYIDTHKEAFNESDDESVSISYVTIPILTTETRGKSDKSEWD